MPERQSTTTPLGLILTAALLAGCAAPQASPPTTVAATLPSTRPVSATAIYPKSAQSEYWFAKPATETVAAADYDKLWQACERVAVQSSFQIERYDYRLGLLTTKPLVSRQFFEIWMGDVVDPYSQIESDLTTHRRVVHFQINPTPDGKFVCEIKAVVEHYVMPERRITAVYQYRDAYSSRRQYLEDVTDEGTAMRVEYWYAERRDSALEHALAARLRARLQAVASVR